MKPEAKSETMCSDESEEATAVTSSRRRFMAGAGATAAALSLGTSPRLLRAIEPASGRFGISFMMWTWDQFKPMTGRLEKIAEMGIDAVEFTRTNRAKNNEEVAAACRDLGLKVHNIDSGTALWGKKSALINPAERSTILENLKRAIAHARLFETDTLLALAGTRMEELTDEEMERSLIDGLKAMMEIVEGEGLQMIMEPLNRFDHKGFYLTKMDHAFRILDEVGSEKLKILYDIYHVQLEEGNVINKIRDNIDRIGHFHVADVPGRVQPGKGEINYPNVLGAIAETHYKGFVGLEYLVKSGDEGSIPVARNDVFNALT